MCEFASFMVRLDGKTLRIAKWDWRSHSQTCKALGIKLTEAEEWSEAEWTDDGLSVRHTDPDVAATLKAAILAKYRTRDDLLRAHAGPAGNEAVLTTDDEGKIVKIEGRLFEECRLSGLNSVTSLNGVTLAEGCELHGLTSVTSLNGVTLAEGCELHGLTSVTSLDGVKLAKECGLSGLTSVTSLDGVTLAKGCWLYGLTGKALEQYWTMKGGV